MGPTAFAQTPRGTTVSIGSTNFVSPNTTYFYSLTSGPDLTVGQRISIVGMSNPGNNGTFVIAAVTALTSFTVANPQGVPAVGQSGTAATAFSPESGALVEITSSDGTSTTPPSILEKVYDSQVHDSTATEPVGIVPAAPAGNGSNCNVGDRIPSDAYLVQAQAPTGCDPGDPFESSLTFVGTSTTPNIGNFDFAPTSPKFHVSSQYVCLTNGASATITSATQNNGVTTYTYTNLTGSLQVGQAVIISGFTGSNIGNNSGGGAGFVITGLRSTPTPSFDVVNPSGMTAAQNASVVAGCGPTPLTVSNVSGGTTFTFATAGPALTTSLLPTGESVQLTGFTGGFAGNNKQFPITSLGTGTFNVAGGVGTGAVTTTATITQTALANATTTYTYDPSTLPAGLSFGLGENATVTCFTDTLVGNNGMFGPIAPGSGNFSATNPFGVAVMPPSTNNTTISNVTEATLNPASGSNPATTTYTFTGGVTGPALQSPSGCPAESVKIANMTDAGNNGGPFKIAALGSGTVTLANPGGVTTAPTSLSVSQASQSGGTTAYTYTIPEGGGPALKTGEAVVIKGMTDAGNNSPCMDPALCSPGNPPFVITALGTGTLTVNNASGKSTTTQINGITAASSNGTNTTYTYTSAGPAGTSPEIGELVAITGMSDSANNSPSGMPFKIIAVSAAAVMPPVFTVVNNGVTTGSTATITSATLIVGTPNTTKYTYANLSGPNPEPNELVTITGMTDAGNNSPSGSPFTVISVVVGTMGTGSFLASNPNGVTTGSTINITNAAQSSSTTTYTYTVGSGPALENGEVVTITAYMNTTTEPTAANDNGSFIIGNVMPTTFTVMNANGANSAQSVTGMVTQNGSGTLTQNGSGTVSQPGSGTATQDGSGNATQVGLATAMPTGAAAMTNTNGTVFSNDTGFMTVTNNNGANFAGTIKLSGNSPLCGQLSDMFAAGLTTTAPGNSVVLALSNDSSSCGGFNQPQTQPLISNQTDTFPIGKDFFQITPISTINTGDVFTVLPIPIPAGPVGAPPTFGPFSTDYLAPQIGNGTGFGSGQFGQITPPASPLRFSATNFAKDVCVPVADFSASLRVQPSTNPNAFGGASTNPVCPLLQVTCLNTGLTCGDADTFLYTGNLGFTADPVVGNGIGGVHYIGQHDTSCPTMGFIPDDLVSYTGSNPGIDYPSGIGGRGNSCFANIYDPNATATANGTTVTTFVGFQNPVVNCPTAPPGTAPPPCTPHPVTAGSAIPLIWQSFDSSGNPVTTLTLCPRADGTTNGVTLCTAPWVFVELAPITCPNGTISTTTLDDLFAGSSALQSPSPGTYQFNFKTMKSQRGTCSASVLGFSNSGWVVRTAEFAFR
jgi:hypothetical protein